MSLHKRTAKPFFCDQRDRTITCVFCRDLQLTSLYFGLLQKGLLKKRWSLAEYVFKRNCCHACHTRFAVFFPLPLLCVSSLFSLFSAPCCQNSWAAEPLTFCYVKNLYDWRQTSNNLSIIARVTKLFKCGQRNHITWEWMRDLVNQKLRNVLNKQQIWSHHTDLKFRNE